APAQTEETPEAAEPNASKTPVPKPQPFPKPTPAPEPEEEEEPGEEPRAEAGEKPKPKGGFQRKIERQARELEYQSRRIQELEYHLRYGAHGKPHEPPQQQQAPQTPR